jgi:hypothetical protein
MNKITVEKSIAIPQETKNRPTIGSSDTPLKHIPEVM